MKRILPIFLLMLSVLFAAPSFAAPGAATAPTQFFEWKGEKVAYRRIGSGPPLIIANRMRGTLDTWDPLFLDKLAEKRTVVTFDYPGVGYSTGKLPSDMSDVATLIKDLAANQKFGTFALAGWSWGGFVTQTALLEYPKLVTHGVLIGTKPPGKGQLDIKPVFLERAFNPVNDLADEEILFFEPASDRSRAAAKRSRDRIYARPGVVDKIPSKPEEVKAYLSAYEVFINDEAGRRDKLTKSATPMLIVSGDNDPSTPAQNWFPLVGKIPRGQLVVLPESGHGPQHQYPELSSKYILDFLQAADR